MYLFYVQQSFARMHRRLEYVLAFPHKRWQCSHEAAGHKQYMNVQLPSPHLNLPSKHLRDRYCRQPSYCISRLPRVLHCHVQPPWEDRQFLKCREYIADPLHPEKPDQQERLDSSVHSNRDPARTAQLLQPVDAAKPQYFQEGIWKLPVLCLPVVCIQ